MQLTACSCIKLDAMVLSQSSHDMSLTECRQRRPKDALFFIAVYKAERTKLKLQQRQVGALADAASNRWKFHAIKLLQPVSYIKQILGQRCPSNCLPIIGPSNAWSSHPRPLACKRSCRQAAKMQRHEQIFKENSNSITRNLA